MTELLWFSAILHSSEAFVVDHEGGPRFRATTVIPRNDRPAHLRYQVDVRPDWTTRAVEVAVSDGVDPPWPIRIGADGRGRWTLDGNAQPNLDGCLDIDLGWTPATNTLPIRRLGLDVGEERDLDVAWLRFPELRLERARQTYRRLDDRLWLYRSGTFEARLTVDDDGYVRRYGDDDLWLAVAAGPSRR